MRVLYSKYIQHRIVQATSVYSVKFSDLAKLTWSVTVKLLILHLLCINTYVHVYLYIFIYTCTYLYTFLPLFFIFSFIKLLYSLKTLFFLLVMLVHFFRTIESFLLKVCRDVFLEYSSISCCTEIFFSQHVPIARHHFWLLLVCFVLFSCFASSSIILTWY